MAVAGSVGSALLGLGADLLTSKVRQPPGIRLELGQESGLLDFAEL